MSQSQTRELNDRRHELLRDHYLFASLDQQQLASVAMASQVVHLDPGCALFHQGDKARHFFLVIEGQIKLSLISAAGSEKIVEVIYPGQTFAEAVAFMTAHRFPVSAVAVSESRLLSISSETYLGVLADSTEACFSLLGDVCRRLRARLADIESLTLKNATHRLVRYLLLHQQPGDPVITLDLSRQDIAAQLSVKPETLSRIIRAMIDARVIAVDGKTVAVLDREALVAYEQL